MMRMMKVLPAAAAAVLMSVGVTAQQSMPGGGGGGGFNVGIGGHGAVGCSDVSRQVTQNWFDVKGILAGSLKARRPRGDDLYCVSPYYMENALPRPVPGAGGLQCYQLQDGSGACCDQQMSACVMYQG